MEVHLIFQNKKISKNGSSSKNISEMAPLIRFSKLKLIIGIFGYTNYYKSKFSEMGSSFGNFGPDFEVF